MFNYASFSLLDVSGNPVTQQVESVVVTDPSGNLVTGMFFSITFYIIIFKKSLTE